MSRTLEWGRLSKEEMEVFKSLKDIKVVFDVGTRDNVDYLEAKQAVYHLFEPSPDLFDLLKNKVGDRKNVYLNNYGLGDKEGLFLYNSALQGFEGGEGRTNGGEMWLPVKTLDWYIEQNDIKRIDFLKIDAEGYEYKVLMGGKKAIKLARYIQIEYQDDINRFDSILAGFKREEVGGGRNLLFTR